MADEVVAGAAPAPLTARARILDFEEKTHAEIAVGSLIDQTDLPLEHRFIPGGYARTMKAPRGTLIIGKIHRYPCFNFITRGRAVVVTENGRTRVEAPHIFVSGAGTKRVILAEDDLEWTTVHVTKQTEPDAIEAEIICANYGDLAAPALTNKENEE